MEGGSISIRVGLSALFDSLLQLSILHSDLEAILENPYAEMLDQLPPGECGALL